jgi:hypothetical protein
MGAIILLPSAIRSFILSGYLIYPVSQIDIFAVDWKIPKDRVEEITQAILRGMAWTWPLQGLSYGSLFVC